MATPTVVLLPIWPAGHLLSMLDVGKRLLARSGGALSLTVLVMQAPTESGRSEARASLNWAVALAAKLVGQRGLRPTS